MTAEQIRAIVLEKENTPAGVFSPNLNEAKFVVLREIAAQLAEFNERERAALRPGDGETAYRVPPARHADPTSGTDQARAIPSPPAAAQSKPTIALRDRWARDRKGNELPNPEGYEMLITRIWKTERKDLSDGRPRLRVSWQTPTGFVDANCFDEKLFPWVIAQSKEPTTHLYLVKSGKYTNIVGVRA